MPLEPMAAVVALGLLAAVLAGVRLPRWIVRDDVRPGTPDDGPLGLGCGRTARCPVCREPALELVAVSVGAGRDLPQVRCLACLSSYAVRGTLTAVPAQRRAA